jgi:pyridoxal phosphate enzyme (YggS family)
LTINQSNLSLITTEIKKFEKADLLIVSKNQTQASIQALIDKGFFLFGENRIQEASIKFDEKLKDQYKNLKLHLIGPLQSNKTKLALQIFDTIQTIDRKKIIDAIVETKKKLNNIRTKNFFIQINIGKESQKSGIMPEQFSDIYNYAMSNNLLIKGIMCIPPNDDKPEYYFEEMQNIKNKINPNLYLSMGMSKDYLTALKYGANLIRVGSKIFS